MTAYGSAPGPGNCPFLYQGQYEDTETGLYYNRFRYYDPEAGSYISQDPIGLGGGLSGLYSYVHDPAVWTDPLGLATCPALENINIDTGSAFAFVSEGSPVRHLLKAEVAGKQMVMTQTAHAEFVSVISTIAGPQEQARASRFLGRTQMIADDASARSSALAVTKKVGANDKIIFGTADKLGIKTLTVDAKFLRGAEAQGVTFDAIVHPPVPLTGL
ncbi:DUF1308 domain-containing protein [Hymenobacter cellulosivorans]|uniref:DUF1308 domain-containing protein n=1 Tax=Hymenobacter cellulosivorans TaxID=2932249 RepID=UPI0021D3FDA6|nr:DUF1308 domain-containing protein [Hymenobacter cellulosivorans]